MTELKTRTISFSSVMIRANLAGLKSQTRRTLKNQESNANWNIATRVFDSEYLKQHLPGADESTWVLQERSGELVDSKWQPVGCPYGKPGDILLVKEAAWMWCERQPNGKTATGRDKWLYVALPSAPIHYAADHPAKPTVQVVSPDTGNQWGWRLKIARFLPRTAVRITLKITQVRLERLQAISEFDAKAEGCDNSQTQAAIEAGWFEKPRRAFQRLWDQINGEGAWEQNPWVWVVSYEIIDPEAI